MRENSTLATFISATWQIIVKLLYGPVKVRVHDPYRCHKRKQITSSLIGYTKLRAKVYFLAYVALMEESQDRSKDLNNKN